MKKRCTKCGAALSEQDVFCGSCGSKVFRGESSGTGLSEKEKAGGVKNLVKSAKGVVSAVGAVLLIAVFVWGIYHQVTGYFEGKKAAEEASTIHPGWNLTVYEKGTTLMAEIADEAEAAAIEKIRQVQEAEAAAAAESDEIYDAGTMDDLLFNDDTVNRYLGKRIRVCGAMDGADQTCWLWGYSGDTLPVFLNGITPDEAFYNIQDWSDVCVEGYFYRSDTGDLTIDVDRIE